MDIFPMILVRAGGLPFSAWNSIVSSLPLDNSAKEALDKAALKVQAAFNRALAGLPQSDFRTAVYNARKAFFQKQKMPSDKVLAVLSSSIGQALIQDLLDKLLIWKTLSSWQEEWEQAYQQCLESEFNTLQKVAASPNFQQSLLFGSHDLLHRMAAFSCKPVLDFNRKDRQIALSIYQYRTRSIFKTSPLGRFTTVQIWRFEQAQQAGLDAEKVVISPSVAMLPALYELLLKEPAFYSSLGLVLNPCISNDYIKGSTLEWLYFDGEREAFQRLESNPVAEWIIQTLIENKRQLPYPKLLELLSDSVNAPKEQLDTLIQELIALGLMEWQLPEKGLSPSWCTNLCNYLSYLPNAAVVTAAAFLLQSLRTSARAIPYQTVAAAHMTQQSSREQIASFFVQHNSIPPPIPTEQIFFEDVAYSIPINCPASAIQQFASDISQRWQQPEFHQLDPFRSRLSHFSKSNYKAGQVVDFQVFCKAFFSAKVTTAPQFAPRFHGKIGAMLQVYRHNNNYRAVVNALFPGGGKLYARWLHLFPSEFRESLERWTNPETIIFPWQGWSNANFQSISLDGALLVPDGRVGGSQENKALLLSDLAVLCGPYGPELVAKKSGKPVLITDLGLEAPESRPPVMQVLWHLGVSNVSASLLLSEQGTSWETLTPLIKKRDRIEYQSLVLSRAAWELKTEYFAEILKKVKSQALRFRIFNMELSALGVSQYFFARINEQRQKPQFFQLESPVSMLLFEKMVLAASTQAIYIEEMLPEPSDWVLGDAENYAGEFVLEFLVE